MSDPRLILGDLTRREMDKQGRQLEEAQEKVNQSLSSFEKLIAFTDRVDSYKGWRESLRSLIYR